MEGVLINSVSEYLKYTQIVSNLSRQKMLIMTICSMLKTRSVVLSEIAVQLNHNAKPIQMKHDYKIFSEK